MRRPLAGTPSRLGRSAQVVAIGRTLRGGGHHHQGRRQGAIPAPLFHTLRERNLVPDFTIIPADQSLYDYFGGGARVWNLIINEAGELFAHGPIHLIPNPEAVE
jgi:hypothetical protein